MPGSLLVHPERRTVWTFRPGAEGRPLRGDDVVDLGDIFEGFSFTVADLFGALRPSSRSG